MNEKPKLECMTLQEWITWAEDIEDTATNGAEAFDISLTAPSSVGALEKWYQDKQLRIRKEWDKLEIDLANIRIKYLVMINDPITYEQEIFKRKLEFEKILEEQ